MILIYAHTNSSRLQYICDFIFTNYFKTTFTITSDIKELETFDGIKINYSSEQIPGTFTIQNHLLLFESGIHQQKTACFEINKHTAFFKTGGDYPFDIFAATFYLLSRYEEYLPHQKDMYGRYAHENSLAFKEGFLQLPLINIWLNAFAEELKNKFPTFNPQLSTFNLIPTYDIDIAWSYKNKGIVRHVGSLVKSLLTFNFSYFKERLKVIAGKQKDPFDTYDWLDELHKQYKLQPIYFFLVADKKSRYDKNIHPQKPAMKALIQRHAEKYPVAIHPSWQSGDNLTLLQSEKNFLEATAEKNISHSRQHYIRFNLPEGYQRLIQSGITHDYSMGYGSINGFRASVASPFYWYDIQNEKQTNLLIHSFCYMEANSFYEQKFSTEQALNEMLHYYNICKEIGGNYISIWHNHMLGSNFMYIGWGETYKQFYQHINL